jgi:hypothetical protein
LFFRPGIAWRVHEAGPALRDVVFIGAAR